MRQEATTNPELLVWARKSINMDTAEAAERIGVEEVRLQEWESGLRRPTVNQAREMARVYRRPLAAFYLPEPPESLGFSVPHDFRRLAAGRLGTPSPELIAELRRIEYLREAALELAESLPEQPRAVVGKTDLSESVEGVSERASGILDVPMATRLQWRNYYDALNGWKDAIERQGVLVMHLIGVPVAEIRGIAIAEPEFPLIAVNGKDSPSARIFTLMHEFVHLMVGASGMSDLHLASGPQTPEERVEHFCNHVAGEVLVPKQFLLMHRRVQDAPGVVDWPDETIGELAVYFKVSREVIVRRLALVGRATDDLYRRKRQRYAEEREEAGEQTGGPMPMSRQILRAIGQPFARIALDAYHREAISSSDLAELLGARLKHLPAVEELLAGANVLTGGDR